MKEINGVDIRQLVEQYGTPLYVYDKQKIQTQFTRLNDAFKSYFDHFHIHFAVKANTNLNVIKALKDVGAGAECASPGEMIFSVEAGYESKDIFYSSNYESYDDIEYIKKYKPVLNLDDIESFKRLSESYIPDLISFRINPGVGRGAHEHITTGGEKAKFGMPIDRAIKAYKLALEKGVKRFGIHTFIGSNNLDDEHFADVFKRILEITKQIFPVIGKKPEFINIGGGIGIPYSDDEQQINLDRMVKNLRDVYDTDWDEEKFGKPMLMMEPGRFFVGEAGYLLTEVTSVKDIHENYIGVNAGMNMLLRPALYGSKHRMTIYGKNENNGKYNVCGQVCENTDFFARQIDLPKAETGDILVIHDVGAYGFVMASTYNNRPRPAEVMIDNGEAKLIRKRQTIEDLINEQEMI